MPIIVKLDDILHARRMTLTQLSQLVEITHPNLSILKTGKARAIRFSALEAICAALQCQPGDLLEFSPDPLPLDELTLDDDGSPHTALKESHHA